MFVGAAHLLFAPFPWQFEGSLRLMLTLPEVVVWWWLLVAGVGPGVRHALRNRPDGTMPLLIYVVGLALTYSLMFGNVGLVYRQRAQLMPWLLTLALVGLEQRWRRWSRNAVPGPRPVVFAAGNGGLSR
jgi:hypothetical protein